MAFPKIIETERLLLRPFAPSDLEALVDIFSNWEMTKWLSTNVPFPYTSEDGKKFMTKAKAEFEEGTSICYAIEDQKTGQCAGNIGLISVTEETEVGYALHPSFWGGGIGTEALKAIIGAAFKSDIITRITAQTATKNLGSQRMLEKVGFSYAGTPPPDYVRRSHSEGSSAFYTFKIEDWRNIGGNNNNE